MITLAKKTIRVAWTLCVLVSLFVFSGGHIQSESQQEAETTNVEAFVIQRDASQKTNRNGDAVESIRNSDLPSTGFCCSAWPMLLTTERSNINGLGTYLLI